MAVRTDADVCNLSIGKIGGEPIEALGEDSPLGAFCQANYPSRRDDLLASYPWRFATVFAPLARITAAPSGSPLPNCFKPPSDLVGDIQAFRDGPSVDCRVVRCLVSSVGIASHQSQVYAEYIAAKPESEWPIWFVQFVASAYAIDLAQRRPDKSLADDLRLEAYGLPEQAGQGGKFLAAMQADGRNAPQRQLFGWDAGELIDARFGGGFNNNAFGRPIIVDTSNGG